MTMVEERVNKFSFDLLKYSDPGNVVISGVSAYMAMAAAIYGARGETLEKLSTLIPVSGLKNKERIRTLWHLLNQDKQTLVTATKILISDKCARSEDTDLYGENVKNVFDVNVERCDFSHSAKQVTVFLNEWVSNLTGGKMIGAIEDVSLDTVMMIINVIYFAGKWNRELKTVSSGEHQYFLNNGNTARKVTMLYVDNVYTEYYTATMENDEFVEGFLLNFKSENVDVNAAESPRRTFEIIVPRNPEYLCKRGGKFDIEHYIANRIAKESYIDVRMPKFKLEHECPLKDLLEKTGFSDAFRDDANFSAITGDCKGISRAMQKAVIEVDEKGVQAAAVTTLVRDSVAPNTKIVADRPFIFLIRDVTTNLILFIGRVTAL